MLGDGQDAWSTVVTTDDGSGDGIFGPHPQGQVTAAAASRCECLTGMDITVDLDRPCIRHPLVGERGEAALCPIGGPFSNLQELSPTCKLLSLVAADGADSAPSLCVEFSTVGENTPGGGLRCGQDEG